MSESTKLRKWALIAEIAGGIAIVVSLIFVGLQVQQNRQAQIHAATQAVISDFNASVALLAGDNEMACIYSVGLQDYTTLSGSQRLRLSAYLSSIMLTMQQMYYLSLQGAMDTETWSGIESLMEEVAGLPGWQQWFSTREHWFGGQFRSFLDRLTTRQALVAPVVYNDAACTNLVETDQNVRTQ